MYFNSHHNDINVSSLNGQDVEWRKILKIDFVTKCVFVRVNFKTIKLE